MTGGLTGARSGGRRSGGSRGGGGDDGVDTEQSVRLLCVGAGGGSHAFEIGSEPSDKL